MTIAFRLQRRFVLPLVVALSAALLMVLVAAYSAQGSSHATTYYACLYAGSLSQVGTTQPANCGRGSMISWNSFDTLGPAGVNTTNVRTGIVRNAGVYGEDVSLANPSDGVYTISYPAGTFPRMDGADLDNIPTIAPMSAATGAEAKLQVLTWGTDGSLSATIHTGGVNITFVFTVTQHIPADATFGAVAPAERPTNITIGGR